MHLFLFSLRSNVTPLEWGSGSLGTSGQLLDAAENSKVCNMMVVSDKIPTIPNLHAKLTPMVRLGNRTYRSWLAKNGLKMETE